LVDAENVLLDPYGTPYARLFVCSDPIHSKEINCLLSGIAFLEFKFQYRSAKPLQRFSKSIAAPPQAKNIPQHKADWVVRDQTTPEQAAIYRLSGDYNPLHIGALRFPSQDIVY